jgi:1,4-dihydroxy-2-naphthoyl-CoA synthase
MTTSPNEDWLDKAIQDATIALTTYTQDGIKVTSFDEILINRPKLEAAIQQHIVEAKIDGINEAHKEILEIVYTYTGGEGLENFCDVDDVSRVAMSWKVDRIAELNRQKEGEG